MNSFRLWLENTLPSVLYHVTTAVDEILRNGFQTALQHGKGTVLGGSFQDAVSFTSSLERAKYYKMALEVTQELLYENLAGDHKNLWYRIQRFKPNYDKLKQLLELTDKKSGDEKIETILFLLPSVTDGRFPAIFGGGLKQQLKPDSTISILQISGAGPQKWTTNPKEEEFRIYDPENIDKTSVDVIA